MKGVALLFGILVYQGLLAQGTVQTIVPLQPIAVGTAFQVQYIVANTEPVVELQSPAFGKEFRFVSGPRLYQGEALINNIKTPIQNFSYTLIPLRKGRLVVKGATVVYKTGKTKSDDRFVVVTDDVKADPLTATPLSDLPRLSPPGTWDERLQEQLFIKADVTRQSCFVGEPVVATFTLFSRLPSASEIIKNPGFYGFSVLDMPDAAEGGQTVQTYHGAFYNTYNLRKVQLYPMQPGPLQLDKMSVANAIEYADSASGAPVHTNVLLETKPMTIAVKPLPATTLQTFSGAVGHFSINAFLDKNEWPQNSSGKLNVSITGHGNFLQLSPPDITWPKGFDVFEPAATERLHKDAVPVAGTRTYTYTFTTDSTGAYSIPAIRFTYFNPAEKKYVTIATDSLHFTVSPGKSSTAAVPLISKKPSNPALYIGLFVAAALAITGILFFKNFRKREKQHTAPAPEAKTGDFEKRIRDIPATDADAYRRLQQGLMGFLKSLPAPEEPLLQGGMQQATYQLPAGQKKELQAILEECEAVQYYNAATTRTFSELQQQAIAFIRSVKQ